MGTNRQIRWRTVLVVLFLSTFVFEPVLRAQSSDEAAIRELASRLVSAKSEQERKTILIEQRALIDVRLRKSLVEQAEALRTKGDYPKSLNVFELARQIAEQIDDQTGIAELSVYVGSVLLAQGKRDPAMDSFQKGLALCTNLQEKTCIAAALLGIGNTYEARADHDLAIDFLTRALTVSEESKNEPGIFRALISLGNSYLAQGNYPKALETYQKALPISESAGNTQRLALVRRNIGVVHRLRGDVASAIESFQKSAELYEKSGEPKQVADVNIGMGIVHSQRGDYSSAMRYFQKSLDVYEKLEDKKGIADILSNFGIVQRLQGNYSLALEYQQKSLALRETGDPRDLARSLNNIGLIYSNQGDYTRALETYQRALKLNQGLGNKSETASVLNNVGVAYRLQGAYDLALETFRKSLEIREQLGERGVIANLLRSMAIAYGLKGEHQQAVTYSERSAAIAREIGFRAVLSGALTAAGNAHLALGEPEKSRAAFEEAIATAEALRGQVAGGAQDEQRFFEGIVSPYYRMVELLASQGKLSEAYSYAERGKARLLLDVLKSGRVDIDKAMIPAERAQEQKIRDSFVLLNTQISDETRRTQPDQKRLTQLKAQLETARLAQQDFQARLYAAHPDLRLHRGDAPTSTLAQANELLTDVDTALLEYVVSDDRTLLFVLTKPERKEAQEPVLKLYELKIKRKELVDRVQKLNQRIADNDLEYAALSSELYESLLGPAREQLKSRTRLVIVPDDILWETPFQALRSTDGRFLIQSAAISYAPSLTVLREIVKSRKPRSSTTLLAMGNPKLAGQTISRSKNVLMSSRLEALPEAERMVKELAQIYGPKSRVYVGAEAREDLLKADAANYRILQLATHGVINNASPMYSHLVLAQGDDAKEDGLLEAWEIMQLDLKADLAVLSACETARGRIGAGEGVIGLAWALFVAGCPTTVVSQWKVESSSTAELMLSFHRNLKSGVAKSEALRQASIKLMSDKRYNHPFYWAGFIVIGDPR